jgi:DME family drug/metabolite transporter
MQHRASTRRALVFVLLAALAWGTGGPTGALLTQYAGLTPLATSFWRLAAAALWLAPAVALRRTSVRPQLAANPLRHLLCGLGLAVCQLGYFTAIPRVGVGIATVVALGAAPILITLFARERFTPALFAALAGLTLLSATTGPTNLTGLAAAITSAAGYSLTTLVSRNTPDPLTTALLGFTTGALLLAPFAAFPSTPTGWLLIAYFGLVPTALAYTLYYAGLNTLKASTAALIALLEPVVATTIGVLAFQEHLTKTALAGAAILLLAITAQTRPSG